MAGEIRWIPVRAAAKMLGVSRQRCAKLCRIGSLVSQQVDSTVLVEIESVRARVKASQQKLEV